MNDSDETEPSKMLVHQRMRNRLIEQLELFASYDEQRSYQENVPWIYIPYELINGWEDWAGSDGEFLDSFVEPVFTRQEQEALRKFQAIWDAAADDVPDDYPKLEELFGTVPWETLRLSAQDALLAFSERGKLSEDTEEVS